MSEGTSRITIRIFYPTSIEGDPVSRPRLAGWERRWQREILSGGRRGRIRRVIAVALGIAALTVIGVAATRIFDSARGATTLSVRNGNPNHAAVDQLVEPPAPTPKKRSTGTDSSSSENQAGTPEQQQSPARVANASAGPGIHRMQLTSGIRGREPIDTMESSVEGGQQGSRRLFCFTELHDMQGETVTHRWEHGGRIMARIRFRVGSDRWRIYSSKQLTRATTGPWRVIITDSRGRTLRETSFVYRSEAATRSS